MSRKATFTSGKSFISFAHYQYLARKKNFVEEHIANILNILLNMRTNIY